MRLDEYTEKSVLVAVSFYIDILLYSVCSYCLDICFFCLCNFRIQVHIKYNVIRGGKGRGGSSTFVSMSVLLIVP